MVKTTELQEKELNKHIEDGWFTCPSCNTEYNDMYVQIENPGEEDTQISCVYGCGYLILEDYRK